MTSFIFDPEVYKVAHSHGGYDSNEKGVFQYPRPQQGLRNEVDSGQKASIYAPCDCHSANADFTQNSKPSSRKIFGDPILKEVESHYRIFIEDPDLPRESESAPFVIDPATGDSQDTKKVSPCGVQLLSKLVPSDGMPLMRKPIDPIHWKPDLFDTKLEKYYLKNILIEDPYREFLTSCSEATAPPHYCSEYRQSFSGNPVMFTASSGRILGISRPTDISEPCHWKRFRTQKLRDVVFTHEKDPIDSHLDYNDPKRYNPWPKLKMSYDQMVEENFRPRPRSGIDYSPATLLPAVSPYSKQWIN